MTFSQEPATDHYPEPVYSFPAYFPKIHSNSILHSTSRSSQWSLSFPTKILYAFLMSPIDVQIPCSSHYPWFDHTNNIWWSAEVMKLHIMDSSIASCHILPSRSKHSLQHPVIEHPQSTFFPLCERPSFTPIQNKR